MSAERILQNEIAGLGQSQDDRSPAALDPAYAPVDARTPADRVEELRRLAAKLRFYADNPDKAAGDWQAYLPVDTAEQIASAEGNAPAHLGLLGAFFDMLAPAQAVLNQVGERHLAFHYQQVLGFTPHPAQSEHVHVCLEAKKGVAPFAITPGMLFSGGKDAQGNARDYAPVRETVIGQGRVTALHSIYRDANGLHFAPVADSADGLGEPLPADAPAWHAFGHAALPAAPVGFAFASSLLRMSEGLRQIRLGLDLAFLAASGLDAQTIGASLEAYVTGEKSWLGPYAVSGRQIGNLVELAISVPAGDPAVVDCNPVLHGDSLADTLPVIKLVLQPASAGRFAPLSTLRLDRAQLEVSVEGKKDLSLENDFGSLNPKKAFQPFGPQPMVGSRFMIGCPEALAKPLSSLAITLTWQGAPADLSTWYANYSQCSRVADGVQARLTYEDGAGVQTVHELDLMARVNGVTTLSPTAPSHTPSAQASTSNLSYLLLKSGNFFSKKLGRKIFMSHPSAAASQEPPPPAAARPGFVTLTLIDDFLHADYRKETLERARNQSSVLLNEPYTPTVQEISLQYSARHPLINLADPSDAAFATAADLQFFHVGAFGARREHAFMRQQLGWAADRQPGLLPAYPDEGEWLIGVAGAGESIHLLVQVAEGSADPDLTAQPVIWSVLCGNQWRRVAPDELILDTTRGLRASGIVGIVLSRQTTTDNTWLPAGSVWLKASVHQGSAATCLVEDVAANAVELIRQWPAARPPLVETLAANTISKMQAPPAGLKKVAQPHASFGGRPAETDPQLRRRAAERLRHRQRCITPWDYERLLLEAFPAVYRIKCIPHASDHSWMAPGHLLIVAIPDLKQHNRPNKLTPRVDLDTLTQMHELAQAHAAPGITVHVRNPNYQAVRLDFGVRFLPGHPFDHTRQQLHAAIVQALSPWAFSTDRPLDFGGRIYRSVLLDLIEELPYVDYVTHFRCGLAGDGLLLVNDVAELVAAQPDVILVSAAQHVITEATD